MSYIVQFSKRFSWVEDPRKYFLFLNLMVIFFGRATHNPGRNFIQKNQLTKFRTHFMHQLAHNLNNQLSRASKTEMND